MNTGSTKAKTVFITNRGGTHPNRVLYFDSVGADYQYVDFALKWHGLNRSKWIMILSGFLCALRFPKRKTYDLFVTSDPQLPAVLMKRLGLLRSHQKIATYLGSQTLYFIHSDYYSGFTSAFYRFLLKSYDFHICNGDLQKELLHQIVPVDPGKVFVNFNGIGDEKASLLKKVEYQPTSQKLLFIGNIYSNWRIHYKGLDVVIDAFSMLIEKRPELHLIIVGMYDQSLQDLIAKKIPTERRNQIELKGKVNDVSNLFQDCSLYVHCSRGDALPNSLIEALYAGVPAVVSDLTGNHELINQIDPKLVSSVDAHQLFERISYFLDLPKEVKFQYAEKAQRLTRELTRYRAVATFQEIIKQITSR